MSGTWQKTMALATDFRHELHSHPELSWQEHRTAERVGEYLTQLGIPWRPCAKTGILATLSPTYPLVNAVPHIALRGDMDALPLQEHSGVAWSSQHPGCMHACGHDGHTATLLATAFLLKHYQSQLRAPVTLIFQPAEEGGHGAREMIKDGALAGIDCIYGWHNWPAIREGKLLCPDGLVMCGNGTFEVTVEGKGGHASQPEQCADPVLAASAIVLALQQAVSRRLAPQQPAVLSVTSIDAKSAPTIIPQNVVMAGSIRVPDEVTRQALNQLIEDVCHYTALAYGVTAKVDIFPRYSATINHPGPAAHIRQSWSQLYGADQLEQHLPLPVMASEDFSYYLQEIPGAFALIGADDGENRHQVSCHSPFYDFNDRLIPLVTRWFLSLTGVVMEEHQ